jgi:hypothetical protein
LNFIKLKWIVIHSNSWTCQCVIRLGGGQERFDECYMQIDDVDEEIKRKDNHTKKKN